MPDTEYNLEALPEGHDHSWDYELPVVAMVKDAQGSHPEPPFTPDMSDLQKLRNLAALIESETGIRIRVCDGQSWSVGRYNHGRYSWLIGSTSGGVGSFSLAWNTLYGVDLGAREVGRVHPATRKGM
jgi:hypothetical protein